MATYLIGDVHGCYDELIALLHKVEFTPGKDTLWLTGDLVARGPGSLDVLRYVKSLGDSVRLVLGNHDLHLLAVAAGAGKLHRSDTIGEILEAPDCKELLKWLRHRPLLFETPETIFVHAGISPAWTLAEARTYAQEVSDALKSKDWKAYLQGMYGDDTDMDKKGAGRMRAILNAFTRMRYVRTDGSLEFKAKMNPKDTPDLMPWFDYPRCFNKTVCFGHWSTLGLVMREDTIAIDTGCLWGGQLTCVRLPDRRLWQVRCPQWASPC